MIHYLKKLPVAPNHSMVRPDWPPQLLEPAKAASAQLPPKGTVREVATEPGLLEPAKIVFLAPARVEWAALVSLET